MQGVEFDNIDTSGIFIKQVNNNYYCDLCTYFQCDYCILPCCEKNLCSNCIDMLFDNTVPINGELFRCLYCNNDVFDIQIKI